MKKHFIVKKEFQHLKEVPFKYEVGDYVTCIEPLSNFDIEDWVTGSIINPEGRGCYKKGCVFKVGNVQKGLAIFPDNRSFIRGGGVYANWIRPATEEEIEEYKKALEKYENEIFDSMFI